jgi:hypothetical protein
MNGGFILLVLVAFVSCRMMRHAMAFRVRSSPKPRAVEFVGLALGLVASLAWQYPELAPFQKPSTYRSHSGRFALLVDPVDTSGRGGASYRLTRDGREVWSGAKAFTLRDACVTEEGVVAGYAYTDEPKGRGPGGFLKGFGEFHEIILDPGGGARLDRATKRQVRGVDAESDPMGRGTILDAEGGRVVIRQYEVGMSGESWRAYRLSDGKALGVLHPELAMPDRYRGGRIVDAKRVAGTPLTLNHWIRTKLDGSFRDAIFTLVDADAKPVWIRELKDDYHVVDESDQRHLWLKIEKAGAFADRQTRGVRSLVCEGRQEGHILRQSRWQRRVGRCRDRASRRAADPHPEGPARARITVSDDL